VTEGRSWTNQAKIVLASGLMGKTGGAMCCEGRFVWRTAPEFECAEARKRFKQPKVDAGLMCGGRIAEERSWREAKRVKGEAKNDQPLGGEPQK